MHNGLKAETHAAGMDVAIALATGGAADAYNALTHAADVWHRVEAWDRAHDGQGGDAIQAHRAMLFFGYAAADADAFTQRADARAALKHAARYGTFQARPRGRLSDTRGACPGLFGGAY